MTCCMDWLCRGRSVPGGTTHLHFRSCQHPHYTTHVLPLHSMHSACELVQQGIESPVTAAAALLTAGNAAVVGCAAATAPYAVW